MDEIDEGVTSSDTPLVAEDQGAPAASSADADSPAATADSGEKPSVLSVVRDVVGKSGPDSPAGKTDGAADDSAPGSPKAVDNEGYTDVPFNSHPRFRQLIGERNALKPDAERYRNLTGFLEENGISGQQAAEALQLQVLLRTDPEKAWAQLQPIAQDLLVRTGRLLPPDLKAQVDAGRLTRDAANLVARERAQRSALEGRMSFEQQVAQQRQEREAHFAEQARIRSLQDAAASWEASASDPRRDPDFAKKVEDLQKEVLFLQRRDGIPDTPEGVKKQLDAALAAVNKRNASFRQPRPAVRPVTAGRSSGVDTKAAPNSVLDIVRAHSG